MLGNSLKLIVSSWEFYFLVFFCVGFSVKVCHFFYQREMRLVFSIFSFWVSGEDAFKADGKISKASLSVRKFLKDFRSIFFSFETVQNKDLRVSPIFRKWLLYKQAKALIDSKDNSSALPFLKTLWESSFHVSGFLKVLLESALKEKDFSFLKVVLKEIKKRQLLSKEEIREQDAKLLCAMAEDRHLDHRKRLFLLQKALTLSPQSLQPMCLLIDFYLSQNEFDKARRLLKKAWGLNPAPCLLAFIAHVSSGVGSEVLQTVAFLVSESPENAFSKGLLSVVADNAGLKEHAESYLEEVSKEEKDWCFYIKARIKRHAMTMSSFKDMEFFLSEKSLWIYNLSKSFPVGSW